LPLSDDQALLEQEQAQVTTPEPIAPAIEKPAEQPVTEQAAALPEESPTTIAQNELPRTAGELPLLALIGSLATSFGFAIRSFRR
jgi:hypothetical protein